MAQMEVLFVNLERYQKSAFKESMFQSYLRTRQCYSCSPAEVWFFSFFKSFVLRRAALFFFMLSHRRVSLSQPLPKAASIKAVKAPQPIDSLIEYHYYQQLACTMTSVKIAN